jgi:hypothetical protein
MFHFIPPTVKSPMLNHKLACVFIFCEDWAVISDPHIISLKYKKFNIWSSLQQSSNMLPVIFIVNNDSDNLTCGESRSHFNPYFLQLLFILFTIVVLMRPLKPCCLVSLAFIRKLKPLVISML